MAISFSMGRACLAMWVATLCISFRPSQKPMHPKRPGRLSRKKKTKSSTLESCKLSLQDEVQAICQVLKGNSWGGDAENMLKKVVTKLTSTHVEEVLKRIENVDMSVGFFLWAGKQRGYRHNSVTYHSILKLVGRMREFQCLEKLLIAMRLDYCKLNTVTFNIVISSYGRAGLTNKAWATLSRMKSFRCIPDTMTYNTLIDASLKKGEWRRVKELYRQMTNSGPSPDSYTFNSLMDGLLKMRRMTDAFLICREMIKSGYLPTAVSYNTMMKGLCLEGRVDEAYSLMKNMMKNGCRPTVVTHNILIDGMCKMGRLVDAANILNGMHEFNCLPDVQTYTVMINGYTEAGQMEEAWNLYLEMKKSGCTPDVVTYGVLMDGFCKADRLEAGFELLTEMLDRKIPLNTIVYTMFVDCLCKTNKADLAYTILDDMIFNHCFPDAITYRALINGLSKSGRTAKAYSLMMNRMKESSASPNVKDYKALIDGLCKTGYIEEAMNWFDEIEGAPDIVTYKLLIGSAYRARRPNDAYKLLRKMGQAGFYHSRKYYLCIILGFCREGDFDSARKVFEDLLSVGTIVSGDASKVSVDISCDASDPANASTLLYKAIESAPSQHLVSFVEVFDFLCQGGNFTHAIKLLDQMMHQDCFSPIFDGIKMLHKWLSEGEFLKSKEALTTLKIP